MNRRLVLPTLACCLFVTAWILAAPIVGLPAGVAASDGLSMGDEGLTINVWVDLEPSVGDVILFEADGHLENDRATHRIVDETAAGYVTKGDGNPATDQELAGVSPVTEGQIAGVVVARVPVSHALAAWVGVTLAAVGGTRVRAAYGSRV